MSLILGDRILDLNSCDRFGGDILLSRGTEVLERHTVGVVVDLARVFGMKDGGDSSSLVPGSLASPGVATEKEDEEMESLVFSAENEGMNLLHKNLIEVSLKKNTDSGKKFVTGFTLETDLKDYTGDNDALLGTLVTVSRDQCAVSCLAQQFPFIL